MHIHAYVHMYIRMYVRAHSYVHMYICTHVHMYTCTYVCRNEQLRSMHINLPKLEVSLCAKYTYSASHGMGAEVGEFP